MQLLTCEAV